MKKSLWLQALGVGALLWLIMFALTSLFVGFGFTFSMWFQLGIAVVAGVLSYVFASRTQLPTFEDALLYGIVWALVGIVLDMMVTYQFDSTIFNSWVYWVGYSLVIAAPMFRYGVMVATKKPAYV